MNLNTSEIHVVGAGLAGSQAALTIANHGLKVLLHEMRPFVQTPAHHTDQAAELVCSNSLRSNDPRSAPGLLKEELRLLGADLIRVADETCIPGGTSLTVDREQFSGWITELLDRHPRIQLLREEVDCTPDQGISILATGPLTSDSLASFIQRLTGEENLFFYDAISPVVDAETINRDRMFMASRYEKGGADFLNTPLIRDEYLRFREALIGAEGVFQHDFDHMAFLGCPPIEKLARNGVDTLRYGPLKPTGLRDPRTGRQPYAVVQLRMESLRSDSFNLVGFQNQLKFGEQLRVFRLIPGLENAEFIRFGQMHRNTYVHAPVLLDKSLSLHASPNIFLAGQLAGVEGYVESIATGWIAGVNACRIALGRPPLDLPRETAMGSIIHYLTQAGRDEFTPVRITFDLLPPLPATVRNRLERRRQLCERALEFVRGFAAAEAESASMPGAPILLGVR